MEFADGESWQKWDNADQSRDIENSMKSIAEKSV